MRYRHRSDLHQESFVLETRRESDGALLWGPVTTSAYVGSDLESIYDTSSGYREVNPVLHFKASVALNAPHVIRQNWGGPIGLFSTGGYPFLDLSEEYLTSLVPFVPSSLRESLSGEALTSFTDEFEVKADVVNFAFETSEIQSLVPRISSSFSKTAAGAFLGWKFGVKPALKDLRELSSVVSYVQKRLAFLRSSYGRPARVGFSRVVDLSTSSVPATLYSDGDVSGNALRLHQTGLSCQFRAGGFITHQLSGLDGIAAEAMGLSAALGVQNPAAIAWEAIPFSFVVDWFTNVQGLVARLNVQPFKGQRSLSRVYHSFRTVATYRYVQHKGWAYPSSEQNTDVELGSIQVERYERYPGLPASALVLTDGSLSSTQQLLALSLVRQRF